MYLQRQAVLLWSLLVLLHIALVRADVNITLEDTASQIIYSPSACGLTLSSAGTETETETENCDSAWRIVATQDASGGTLTTTSGPTDGSGGLVPQIFLSVRARALFVKTSPSSNAIANVTVSSMTNPIVSVRSELNSSVDFISIIGLPEDIVTTLSLAYVASNITTHLDIDSIAVLISDNNTTPFVSPPLPSATMLPTVTPSILIPSPTQTPMSSGQTSGDIAAEVLGALLGTALLAAVIFLGLLIRRRRRRPAPPESEEKSEA